MENVFRKWDRVYHFVYGWGNIVNDGFPLEVEFDSRKGPYRDIFKDGYLLSFTEYELEGFTQERPEELPNKGDIVWVRDDVDEGWRVSHFFGKKGNFYVASVYYLDPSPPTWKEISTKNPYENEQ